MSAWRTYYHLVWATHNREHWLTPERMTMLQQAFRVVARDQGAFTHAVGGMPDHVHVAVSIPPTIAVSEYVKRLKGSSSRFINKTLEFPELDAVTWQREFGVDTFSQRSLQDVIAYVENQAVRHATNDLWRSYESLPTSRDG